MPSLLARPRVAVFMAGVCAVLCANVSAQSALDSSADAYRQALEAVLADPGNPQKSFDFVQAATNAGDLRGATSALERILLLDPRLANIRLELGVLYQRLGNRELARYHLEEALRAPNMPSPVRKRAERYLASTGTAGDRNVWSARMGLGYRHESNANAAPDSPFVTVTDVFTGQPVRGQLPEEALEREDDVLEGWARFGHSFLFASGSGSSWDSALTLFGSRYSDLEELDQLGLRFETGPGFVFAAGPNAFSRLRPFATFGRYQLDGEDYIDAAGAGIEWIRQSRSGSATSFTLQYVDQDFENLPGLAPGDPVRFLEDRSGGYVSAELGQMWQIGRAQLGVVLLGEQANADADYQSYDRYGGGLNARVYLGGTNAVRWTAFASGIVREARYDAADIVVDPLTRRKDTRVDASLGVELAFTSRFALVVQGGYTDNSSNLPNYEYENVTAALSFVVGF